MSDWQALQEAENWRNSWQVTNDPQSSSSNGNGNTIDNNGQGVTQNELDQYFQPPATGVNAIPTNLYDAVKDALWAAGVDPGLLTNQQWSQINSMIQSTPTLWDFYQNQGIEQSGAGATNALGQSEYSQFVKMITSALTDPTTTPSQQLLQFGQGLQQQQGTSGTSQSSNLVSSTEDLPNSYAPGNCTYYVAAHYQLPGAMGNASDWWGYAQSHNMPTSATPQVGSIVVYGAGGGYSQYGHVAIVTAVNGDGTFQVSEMNYMGLNQVDSRKSTMADVSGFILAPGPLHGSLGLSAQQQEQQQQGTNQQLQDEFPGAVSTFQKYFGRVPTATEILQTVGATGITTSGGSAGAANGFVAGTPSQWQSVISAAASQYGMGTMLLSAQIKQESGFNANAVSSAGALGIAQIMPGTAASWGVNPMDPTAAINAMAQHMAQYKQQYGSWANALIAYNGGGGAVGNPPAQSQAYVADISAMVGGNVENAGAGGGSSGTLNVSGANTDAAAMENNVRAMPSHLAGMNEGQYTDIKAAADTVSQKLLGHTATDGIVQMLFDQGQTQPNDIAYWYNMQGGTKLAQDESTAVIYNSIVQATSPMLQAVYGENGFDPNIANQQYAGATGPSAGTGADTGAAPPPPTAPPPGQTKLTPFNQRE